MRRDEYRLTVPAILAASVLLLAGACAKRVATTLPPPPPSPATLSAKTPTQRVGPDFLYPDSTVTPGKADTVSAADLLKQYPCPSSIHKASCTYSQSHRKVSDSEHEHVYDEYSVPQDKRNAASGEVDHLDPLCNGGSNDIENLWYQPAVNTWNGKNFGYHEKDDLEAWVCRQVKAKKLDPKTAAEKLTTDWVAYYLEAKPSQQRSGPID